MTVWSIVFLVVGIGLVATGIIFMVTYNESDKHNDTDVDVDKGATYVELDTQFSEDNYPSRVYRDMFTRSSPWIGGFTIGNGKTYKAIPQKNVN